MGCKDKCDALVLEIIFDRPRLIEQISIINCSGFNLTLCKIFGISSRGIESQITSAFQARPHSSIEESLSISITSPKFLSKGDSKFLPISPLAPIIELVIRKTL